MDPILYVFGWFVLYWPYILGGIFCVLCAFIGWAACAINKTPAPTPLDVIDEEIRREKIECHNTSLDYAEMQLKGAPDPIPHCFAAAMLSSAFKSGARWQRDR